MNSKNNQAQPSQDIKLSKFFDIQEKELALRSKELAHNNEIEKVRLSYAKSHSEQAIKAQVDDNKNERQHKQKTQIISSVIS